MNNVEEQIYLLLQNRTKANAMTDDEIRGITKIDVATINAALFALCQRGKLFMTHRNVATHGACYSRCAYYGSCE